MKTQNHIQNETGQIHVEVSPDREFITISIDDYDTVAIFAGNKAEALKLAQMIFEAAKQLE